jgi:hypothetical protein
MKEGKYNEKGKPSPFFENIIAVILFVERKKVAN